MIQYYIMNIFALDEDPNAAAKMHCDKHVVKMIVESAQMLSTAHRYLDGKCVEVLSAAGRKKKEWHMTDYHYDQVLYKVAHVNHPSSIWTRESKQNYIWHYELFLSLCDEYKHRYGKVHATEKKLQSILSNVPVNCPATGRTPFKLAMKSNPECMFPEDPVKSYRLFYQTKQSRFNMKWTKRNVPAWFTITKV